MAKAPPSAKRDRIKAFTPALVAYTDDVVYGDLWERKALSKRDRQWRHPGRNHRSHYPHGVLCRLACRDVGRAGCLHGAGRRRKGSMTMANDVVVGFIGLGTMGGKMATNILKAGYKVVVHDLQRQSAGHHLQAGAQWADTPRALAERSDVIFTSLPEPMAVSYT